MKNLIAQTIAQQIGNKALTMIGARNLGAGENFLQFKIGRNSKSVTHVKITLNGLDLYNVEFIRVRNFEPKVVSEESNVYEDMLRGAIERNTGLYTSL